MSSSDNYIYEPSEQLEMELKKYLSQYLCSGTDGCTSKEYDKIFYLLCTIETKFYEENYISNDDSNLTFEAKRDKKAQDMKQFAYSKILKKLCKLKEKRNKYNSDEEDQGWTKCETNIEKIVRIIWKIWCHERERRPRAGIIPLYHSPSDSIEILLTIYYKNNSIQYGFAKGKFEFWEDRPTCAAREGGEELGLDARYIYKLIQHLSPIKKTVYYADIKTSIDHYYFVIPVRTKQITLQTNEEEIHGAVWHDIFTLPCCSNCQIKQWMQSTDSSTESNYFMVTCADRYQHNSLVLDILMYMDTMHGSQTTEKYKTMHRLCRRN